MHLYISIDSWNGVPNSPRIITAGLLIKKISLFHFFHTFANIKRCGCSNPYQRILIYPFMPAIIYLKFQPFSGINRNCVFELNKYWYPWRDIGLKVKGSKFKTFNIQSKAPRPSLYMPWLHEFVCHHRNIFIWVISLISAKNKRRISISLSCRHGKRLNAWFAVMYSSYVSQILQYRTRWCLMKSISWKLIPFSIKWKIKFINQIRTVNSEFQF